MKKILILLFFQLFFFQGFSFSQEKDFSCIGYSPSFPKQLFGISLYRINIEKRNDIYLKDGSIIKNIQIVTKLSDSYTLKLKDGTLKSYNFEEIQDVKISKQKRLGIYLDTRLNIFNGHSEEDSNFYSNISINKAENIFEDRLISKDEDWFSLNIGITKVLTNQLYSYFGIGFTVYDSYRKYKDDSEILGNNGNYWIKDDEKSKVLPNFIFGILRPLNKKYIAQIGAELNPMGIMLGIGYVFLN